MPVSNSEIPWLNAALVESSSRLEWSPTWSKEDSWHVWQCHPLPLHDSTTFCNRSSHSRSRKDIVQPGYRLPRDMTYIIVNAFWSLRSKVSVQWVLPPARTVLHCHRSQSLHQLKLWQSCDSYGKWVNGTIWHTTQKSSAIIDFIGYTTFNSYLPHPILTLTLLLSFSTCFPTLFLPVKYPLKSSQPRWAVLIWELLQWSLSAWK